MNATRVLVVDDSNISRTVVVRTLQRAGFEVLEANDGAEGAVVAMRERPAVVVTDLEMPIMDGYQLLRLLKNNPFTEGIPVLVVTSHGEAPSRFWGLQTGADAYLTKDFEPEELIDCVTRLARQAKPSTATGGDPPQGPLDVLTIVARQLDSNLLEATLVNRLLERGMTTNDLHETSRVALETIGQVVDSHILAIGVSEPETVTLHLVLTRPASQRTVEASSNAVLNELPFTPGATVDVRVDGSRNSADDLDVSGLVFIPLPLRGSTGILALLPRDSQQFEVVSNRLVQRLSTHLAVLLDNARLSQRLQELSSHDGLTRLLNHRAIYERLEEELQRGHRFGHPVSVVICDLDHFKRVNDSFGHLAGDAVLRSAATIMRHSVRATDVIGRYGGEEFLSVLPESDLDSARQAAERLRKALATNPIAVPNGSSITITGSFGVATASELTGGGGAESLVALADRRLYQAKAEGRNCVRP
jgi:two-component system, cell cycle response regulator